ncbi:MAG TPA: hypothetical protein VFY97_10645 [Rhodanobacteraceae bacterium]|nr:hypothetical protein [Rhodanobacteraceae bacterium]
MRIVDAGHAVFALTMLGVGILGFVQGDFVQIWQPVPKAWPAREALVYLCAAVSLSCGAGLLWCRTAATAARVLFFYLLVWMLLVKVRFIFLAPTAEVSYQSNGENAVVVAGAWVLYATLASAWDRRHLEFFSGETGLRVARALFALALIAFGLSHFFYLQFTAPLVPAWLPWPVGWAYFTGCTYLAAGLAVLTGVCAKPAALLVTLQMGLLTLLVWPPLALAGTITAGQWGEFAVSWILTAAAWVVANSYHGAGWFVARARTRVAT